MRIRKRDGTIAVVSDNYIIQDGETLMVPMSMLDSARRMITDSRGNPCGQRPGFMYSDDSDIGLAVKETVYKEYADAISARWQSDRWSGPSSKPAPVRPLADASLEQAHAQYRRDIEARWQK